MTVLSLCKMYIFLAGHDNGASATNSLQESAVSKRLCLQWNWFIATLEAALMHRADMLQALGHVNRMIEYCAGINGWRTAAKPPASPSFGGKKQNQFCFNGDL